MRAPITLTSLSLLPCPAASFILSNRRNSKFLLIRPMTTTPSTTELESRWSPLTDLLDADPIVLSSEYNQTGSPRLAKDADFATAVQNIWKEEISHRAENSKKVIGSPITYRTKEGASLYGYVERYEKASTQAKVPGILLFHTGAGPQDIFLRWKAESIISELPCVVLICDIIGDGVGWAWDADRTKYSNARDQVMTSIDGGERAELQSRIRAAVGALCQMDEVDSSRLAALGYCMGGHPILEMARMRINGMKAVVTFHGVFDGVKDTGDEVAEQSDDDGSRPHALICNGSSDPFVSSEQLNVCERIFRRNNWNWELLPFEGAKHGWSNPAQDFNPSEAFAYNEVAANSAWKAACELLKRKLSD